MEMNLNGAGVCFHGAGGCFRCRTPDWPRMLRIALRHGWKPEGTEDFSEEVPCEIPNLALKILEYSFGSYELVSDDDAQQLGAALERALPKLEAEHKVLRSLSHEEFFARSFSSQRTQDLMAFASPPAQAHIRAFIQFCRTGGFELA